MLNKQNKILITVISLIILIFVTDCVIGFTLGGIFTAKHWFAIIPINIIFALLSIWFIKGKAFIKSKKIIEPLILISVLLVLTSYVVMGGIARLFSNQEGISYDTIIVECYTAGKSPRTEISFYDRNGNLQTIYSYKQIWFDDESVPEKGKTITIKETKSAFGDTLYTIENTN